MIDIVRKTITKYGLLEKGNSVTVGLSGGADSITLISVLYALKDEMELTLSAVHVNHMIRGEEALRDEAFVRAFCEEKKIPLTVFHKDIPALAAQSGECEEECGRRIRYECFNEVCSGGKIATAHTLSDSTETMLFNMLRGSSLAGICGIPARRDNIIRPLIDCTREMIEAYCEENKLQYVTDSTNLSSDYTRNYIRREIMPMFSKVNSAYMNNLRRLREFAYTDNAYLENEAKKLLCSASAKDGIQISVISKADDVLKGRALVSYIKEKSGISPQSRHIELLCNNINSDFSLNLSDEYRVIIKNGTLTVEKKEVCSLPSVQCIPLVNGINYFGEISVVAEIIGREDFFKNYNNMLENAVDYDKIEGSIFIRNRLEGDKVFLKKRKVTKSLKKLFCEMKIPVSERAAVPVVADSKKVLWTKLTGTDGNCCVTEATKTVLLLKIP